MVNFKNRAYFPTGIGDSAVSTVVSPGNHDSQSFGEGGGLRLLPAFAVNATELTSRFLLSILEVGGSSIITPSRQWCPHAPTIGISATSLF